MGDFMDFFDLHCDTLTECMDGGDSLLKNKRDIDFERGKIFGRWNQVFAVFIPDETDDSLAESYFDSACDFYLSELKKKGDFFPVLSSEDVRGHSRGVILAMESSRGVGSLERLEKLYERGLRLITLTWNGKNRAAGGCLDGSGLSDWGRELVAKAEELGIVVDVSHLSDRGFYDLCEFTDAPFIASHSDSRAVCCEPRSLTDDQIKIIIERGGLIGLNFHDRFLGGNGGREELLRHAGHMLSLGAENALCIGSDYDGCGISPELRGMEKVPGICVYFEENGIPEEICRKIFFENAAHFFEKVLQQGRVMI